METSITCENFERAQEHLRKQGIPFKYVEYTAIHSLYLTDPDGYEIELSTYEL